MGAYWPPQDQLLCDTAKMKALALVTSLLCDLEQVSLPLFMSFIGLFAYQMRFCFYPLREEMLSFSFSFFKQIIIYIKKWTSVNF